MPNLGHFARDKVCPAKGTTCAKFGKQGIGQLVVEITLRVKWVLVWVMGERTEGRRDIPVVLNLNLDQGISMSIK